MKFICSECQELMSLAAPVQPDDDGSIAVTFSCGSCDWGMTMLINPGESQMVKTLGVKLGGEQVQEPMAMMRSFLAGATGMPHAADASGSSGKCPFAHTVKNVTDD